MVWQLKGIFILMGADQTTLPPILSYMKIWLFTIPAIMFTMVCSSTFRAIGDTKTSAKIAISMTLSNIILNPILIFGWGPIPEYGVMGAAIATNIGRGSAVLFQLAILFFGWSTIQIRFKDMVLRLTVMLNLIKVSLGGIAQFLIKRKLFCSLFSTNGCLFGSPCNTKERRLFFFRQPM